MHQVYGTNSRHISWLYLFLGGFLIGIFVMNIWNDLFLQDMELLNAASLSRLRYMKVDGGTFFLYVLRERMGTVALLCIFATTYLGVIAVSIYTFGMGAMAGIVLSVASIRYGIKGILLILASVLPQYLLLVPAYMMLLVWCYRICTALYHPERNSEAIYGMRRPYLLRKAAQLLVILGIILLGSALESYMNPVILSGFLKIF